MQQVLDRIATIAVAVAAIAVAVVVVKREISPARLAQPQSDAMFARPTAVPDWRGLSASGTWIGDSTAPIVVVEFSDYECPYCRQFDKHYQAAKGTLRDSVALLLVHLPISNHRFARPAARAAMCAHEQGKFAEYHSALFEKQDSLGLKSWGSFALDVGVADTTRFGQCAAAADAVPAIVRGQAAAESLHVEVTPTVLINGWRFALAPTDSLLRVMRSYAADGHK